ncbi:MAG: PilZ domain-containing protein [Candidatus Omnitrophica bacterium]|nr:PilZ domain-containing protein [Candidatus Omnitrophota bacterium]MDD5488520.1 PilZ domain-containing protein [Candidatus Omnitrophota bacterium]
MEERRKWKRHKVTYPVEFDDKSSEQYLEIVDLSAGGMAFTFQENLKERKSLPMRIYLKKKMFCVKATPVYSEEVPEKKFVIGAKFEDPTEDFLNVLDLEIREISDFRKEFNLYNGKNISFEQACMEYLANSSPIRM